MFIKSKKRISLLRYWTTRYLVTLFIGLVIIAFISIIWIKQTTLENRLNLTKYLAEEAADRVLDSNGQIIFSDVFSLFLEERKKLLNIESEPLIHIVNNNGRVLYRSPGTYALKVKSVPISLLENPSQVQILKLETGEDIYIVKSPIEDNHRILGWVVIFQSKSELQETNQEYRLLATLLIGLALLGWLVIYFLSRKIAEPIKEVAYAAKQIKAGNYQVELPKSTNEQEVHELIDSFVEMSERLQQLESLRAELLAGITHELKTPVTSISSLTQALKDEVVSGEEAKEFLAISLKETDRLQKMIEDLLDFNSFSAGAISINKEKIDLTKFIKESTHQWYIVRDTEQLKLNVSIPDSAMVAEVDPIRVEQIMLNLLNNAKDAMNGQGSIDVKVYELGHQQVGIDVKDSGIGIPEQEQELIFERFFRGEHKKHNVRGLGLGLPFSRMLSRAMEGDLILKDTSSKGTTFTLKLPRK